VTSRRGRATATAAALFVAALGVACSPPSSDTTASRPNLVLILADDLGFSDVGFHGGKIPTPEIDRLAASGTHFTQAYATATVCAPSRAAILTGRYQNRFGFEFNILETGYASVRPASHPGLPASETTLAELLAEHGYASAIVGKWHLGLHPRFSPLSRGFDEFFGTLLSSQSYFPGRKGRFLQSGGQGYIEDEYLTDAFTREAVDFIARHRDGPFFLFLSYTAVHTPMQATRKSMSKCGFLVGNRRQYCGMLRSMDDGIGRVLDALREHGIEDDTIVVFTNDNGGALSNHALNLPLRGFKGDFYEGGLRVPMVIRWPGRVEEGAVYSEPVSTLDIFATFAAAAGAGPPPRPIDGVDLLPFLSDPDSDAPHPNLFWRRGRRSAVRSGDWKLLRDGAKVQLFNLARDPGERVNLRAAEPARIAILKQAYAEWESEMARPRWKRMRPQAPRRPRRVRDRAPG
jgi:arylsulfatase A-like enzyme